MAENKIKKFMCTMLSSIMLVSAFPAAIHAEENADTVSNEHYAISGEMTDGVLNAVITDKIGNENIKAYIAEYDGEKLVKVEIKTELQTGENRITYPLDDETDVVKIFLWKDETTPVIDAFKKEVNATSSPSPTVSPTTSPISKPTATPTASPTAKPTVSPSPSPTTEPTTEPTATPTASPTVTPTASPTATPTANPTATPTATPTASPTATPTASPSPSPTASPMPNITATYKFDFGNSEAADGYTAVTPNMVYDMSKTDAQEGYCGFLGTTENSYANDKLSYNMDKSAVDGFSVVRGQYITLTSGGTDSATDADSDYIAVPAKTAYMPENASDYEGRYPIRFSMKADRASYYTVTATLTNSSSTEDACVSLFSEKRQIVAEDVAIKPNEKITFKFSVDIEDVYNKIYKQTFKDNMLNISVSGKNAAISSLIVEKHGKTDSTIRGTAEENGVNDGTTMWICTDSTGCDYGASTPFFALQNYAGSGQAFVKYMPENIAVSNQGERGLASQDNAHFNQCMLKPGDYLLVQYGHNESGNDKYYENLSKYYDMAEKSGAKLIIASPVNRHQDRSLVDGVWKSDFTSIITKAEQFVKKKIDAGKTNIAFVDLNTLYVAWMNSETKRIKEINPSLNEQGAMSFYYRSVTGSKVDGTHMNDAGADQAAYCFFKATKDIVEAADGGSADTYIKTQAEVVRPLVEGMKTKIGNSDMDNLPMSVSDEIINSGKAPNVYWDTEVASDVEYKNSVAIDNVETVTNEDGSITLSAVTVRLMNTIDTYAKAVVTVTDNGEETKYYTESNYDFTGAETGATLCNSGFITSDKNDSDVSDSDRCETITIPAGALCTIQIVSCDDTWIVGENPTVYSAVYNVYHEKEVILGEDGSTIDSWTVVTGGNNYSQTVTEDTDGSKYISIKLPGVDKSYSALYKQLDKELSTGRYKLSFVTRLNEGTIRFALVNSVGNERNPLTVKTYMAILDNGKLYSYDDKNSITTIVNENGSKEGKFNIGQWINVECIVDFDLGKEYISVAGSDYSEFDIADWQQSTVETLPIKYLAIAGNSGGIDSEADVKNIKLTEIAQGDLPQKNITVNIADASHGSVTINGENTTSKQVNISSAVTLKAVPSDGYKFVSWTDDGGTVLSDTSEYSVPRLQSDLNVTANFEAVAVGEIVWNFAEFADNNAVTADTDKTYTYEKDGETLKVALKTNDQITSSGIVWANKTLRAQTDKVSGRYIEYTPSKSGTLSVTFQGNTYTSSNKPRMYIASDVTVGTTTKANLDSFTTTQKSQTDASAANAETKVSFDVTAGKTYHIFSYCYNKNAVKFTISNITLTPTSE